MVEAVVHVGCQETPYVRCGRGRETVVVVTSDPAERTRLVALFTPEYGVVAPLVERSHPGWFEDATSLTCWLRGVIDCLGLERPLVVVRSPGS
jgi:hypothetical protein